MENDLASAVATPRAADPGPGLSLQPPLAPGAEDYAKLRSNGISAEDADAWKADRTKTLLEGGMTGGEVAYYWGDQAPDPSALNAHTSANLANLTPANQAKVASNPLEQFWAGHGTSVPGTMENRGKPSIVGNPNAGWVGTAAYAFGNFSGNILPMIAGGLAGGVMGSAIGPEGTVIGAGAGAFALPTAMREVMLDAFAKGDIHTMDDFYKMALGNMVATGKSALAGGAGGVAAVGAAALGAGAAVVGVANATGAVFAQSAMEGRIPDAKDFLLTAVMALGTHAALSARPGQARPDLTDAGARVKANAEDIYRNTGIPPWELVRRAQGDAVLQAELLAQDPHGNPVTPTLRTLAPPEPPPYQPVAPLRMPPPAGGEATEEPTPGVMSGAGLLPLIERLETGGAAGADAEVSTAGAQGRYQIMPGTARQYGFDPTRLHDRDYNTMVATTILNDLYTRYHGDVPAVLIAYNAGPGVANRWLAAGRDNSVLPHETQGYLAKGLGGVRGGGTELYTRPEEFEPQVSALIPPKMSIGKGWGNAGIPDPSVIGNYLGDFAKEAGFEFRIGPELPEPGEGTVGPAKTPIFITGGPLGSDRMVRIPEAPEELYQRWFGQNRYQIVHHEVGHAVDAALNNGKTTKVIGDPELQKEMIATSQQWRPAHWATGAQRGYLASPAELMADNIATWISDPTMRAKMPLFAAKYKERLKPYVDIAQRALPQRTAGGWRTPPGVDEPPGFGGGTGGAAGGNQAGGSGAVPPPPPPGNGVGNGGPPGPPKPPGEVGPATPPEPPVPPINLSPDMMDDVLSDFIGQGPKRKALTLTDTYRQWITELQPATAIDRATEGYNPRTTMGAEDIFRQTYGSTGRVRSMIYRGGVEPILDSRGNVTEYRPNGLPSLQDVTGRFGSGGDMKGFMNYMNAKRGIEKADQGHETGLALSRPDLERFVADRAPIYERAMAEFQGFANSGLWYAKQAGYISADQYDRIITMNQAYASWRRIMGDDRAAGAMGRSFRTSQVIKNFEGSDKQILNPIVATIDNLHKIVSASDRNIAIGYVIGLQEGRGATGAPADLGLRRIEGPEGDPATFLQRPGSTVWERYGVDDPEALTPMLATRANNKFGPNSNRFIYIRNGVPELWEARDPNLAQLMRGSDTPGEAEFFTRMMNAAASFERAGIVTNPAFPLNVGLRHQFTAWIADPAHPPPLITFMRGVFGAFEGVGTGKHGDLFWDWAANGGSTVDMTSMDRDLLEQDIQKMFGATTRGDMIWNAVKTPLQWFQGYHERVDAAPRIGYTRQGQEAGLPLAKAAIGSRTAMLDFAERGTSEMSKWLARAIPFLRPELLGDKQFAKAFLNGGAKMTGLLLSTVAGISILNYAMNYLQDKSGGLSENEKWGNINQTERDTHIIGPQVMGMRLKLPVYYTVVGPLVNGLVNRFMDHYLKSDPHAFDGFATSLWDKFMPLKAPALVAAPLDVATNHNPLSGLPLVSDSVAERAPPFRYTESTSEAGKALAKLIPPPFQGQFSSPIAIDHMIQGYGGTTGMDIAKLLNIPLRSGGAPPWTVKDLPIVGGYIATTAGASAKPIQDFYTEATKLRQENADMSFLLKETQHGAATPADVQQARQQLEASLSAVTAVEHAMSVQRGIIEGINHSTTLTNHEKISAIDGAYNAMIKSAEAGMARLEQVRQAREAVQKALHPISYTVPEAGFGRFVNKSINPAVIQPGADVPAGPANTISDSGPGNDVNRSRNLQLDMSNQGGPNFAAPTGPRRT